MGDIMTAFHANRWAAACAAIVGLGASTCVLGQTLKTENFDDDPAWIGVANTPGSQMLPPPADETNNNNFGFRMSDQTGSAAPTGFAGTVSGAGEIGGMISRAFPATYGDDLGG